MPSVIHGVSWLFIQTSRHTGPVFGLGPFDTVCVCVCVWVSSSGWITYGMNSIYKYSCVQ